MRHYLNKFRLAILLTVFTLALSCGRKSVVLPEVQILGKVQAGPVSGAQVEIYELDEQAQVGRLRTTTQTDAQGFFSVKLEDISEASYLLAKAKGGEYVDEASQQSVSLREGEYFQSILKVDSATLNLPITPLTEWVAAGVLHNRRAAKSLQDSVAAFTLVIEIATGLNAGDLKALPASPADSLETKTAEKRLDTTLTSLSNVLEDLGIPPSLKNNAYANISDQVAQTGKLRLTRPSAGTISAGTTLQENTAQSQPTEEIALPPLLRADLQSVGVNELVPLNWDEKGLAPLSSSCGSSNGVFGQGEVCCDPQGCEGVCTYAQKLEPGQSCGEAEKEKEDCENCLNAAINAVSNAPLDFEEDTTPFASTVTRTTASALACALPSAGAAAMCDGPFPVGDCVAASILATAAVIDLINLCRNRKEAEDFHRKDGEAKTIERIAKEFGIDRRTLGKAIERYKKKEGIRENIGEDGIREVADMIRRGEINVEKDRKRGRRTKKQ